MSSLALALVLALAGAPAAPRRPAGGHPPRSPPPLARWWPSSARRRLGTITIGLDQDKAPITVRNFLGYVARRPL